MNNIETIVVSSATVPSTFIAYTDIKNERKFKIKSSDKDVNNKLISRDYILNFICGYLDKKIISKTSNFTISVKKLKNTIILLFEKSEYTKSYYDEDDNFVFPKFVLNSCKLISIKQFYGNKLDKSQYHTRSSSDRWILDNYETAVTKDIRLKLYKMILESVLIKNYKVSVNCNLYSEILIDIQTKKDVVEVL